MRIAPKKAAQPRFAADIAAEIERLCGLSLRDLRAVWAAEFRREPPKGLWRDLLLRTLAWRLQERAFGGHDKVTLKLLDASGQKRAGDERCRRLKARTLLIRDFGGDKAHRHDRAGWISLAGEDLSQPVSDRPHHYRHKLERAQVLWPS